MEGYVSLLRGRCKDVQTVSLQAEEVISPATGGWKEPRRIDLTINGVKFRQKR